MSSIDECQGETTPIGPITYPGRITIVSAEFR